MPQPTRTILRLCTAIALAAFSACGFDDAAGGPELMVHDVAAPKGHAGEQRVLRFVANLSEAAEVPARIR